VVDVRCRTLVWICLVVVVAGGCTTNERSGEPAGEEPVRGGRLVVAIQSDPEHLNPAITTSGGTHTAAELLYNGLVEVDPGLKPVPELAESWQIEQGGQVYRFRLRDGVKWHDGQPFTSADVKFSFEQVLLKYHSRAAASIGPALDSVEAPDPRTVEFRFKYPYAPLLQQLDVTEAPIIAKHLYESSDPLKNRANIAPVGTGPFKFVSYKPGAEVRLARNPDYFKPGLPYLDEVVMRVAPEAASQVVSLEAGEVQWLWGVPGPDQPRLQQSEDLRMVRTNRNPGGSNCIMTLSFNLQLPVLKDVRVRRAIAHAVDRQQFLQRVLFGEGAVATAPISSGIGWAHASDLPVPQFETARSAALLDAAGWRRQGDGTRTARGVTEVRDGTPLTLDFVHFPAFKSYGELLRAQLREVGIDLKLRPQEPPVFAETVFTKRDFDTNIISYCNGTDPEIGVRRMYDSARIGPVPFSNAAAYRNRRVDGLLEQAARTLDQNKRADLYRQMQQIAVEDLPYLGIVETLATRASRANCAGFKPYGLFAEAAYCAR
jgi:peptide/nickel transport system substrate-binding protein